MAKINPIELSSFRYGLGAFCVKQGRKRRWGIMDTGGNIIIEPNWIEVGTCGCHEIVLLRAPAQKDPRFYDIVRRKFIPGIGRTMSCKRVVTRKGRYQGLEDLDGNIVIPHKYRRLISGISINDLVMVESRGKMGMFYADGTMLLPVRYDYIRMQLPVQCDKIHLSNILFPVTIADKWFFANALGERPLKRQYGDLKDINTKGYCIFGKKQAGKTRDMRYGVIDQQENILIPAIYEDLDWAKDDDRLMCKQHGKYGIIDCCGNEIIPCIYNNMWTSPAKTHIVYTPIDRTEISFVIDEIGRIVLPPRDWFIQPWNGAFGVYDRKRCRYGVYSSSGEEILPIEYEMISMNWGDTLDYIGVCKNGEWYYVNSRNERVLL